jgi:D-glycerate 3-kinase
MDALPLLLDWLKPRLGHGPLIVGLAGAQGSGKSTLAAGLAQRLPCCAGALPDAGGSVVAVSLDDFYLTRARRQALAAHVHPLFATRGPPGTHDLPLLLDALLRIRAGRPVNLPVFDKLADDRLPPQHWRRFGRIDVLILEGWCIGARPQPAALLAEPVNDLEASEDPAALWRTHINQALAGTYQRAWAMLDARAFLAAPDWETVPRWRAQQEAGLARATGRPGMDAAALARFCAHYERLTRWQLATTPRHAGLTLRLDAHRQVIGTE